MPVAVGVGVAEKKTRFSGLKQDAEQVQSRADRVAEKKTRFSGLKRDSCTEPNCRSCVAEKKTRFSGLKHINRLSPIRSSSSRREEDAL